MRCLSCMEIFSLPVLSRIQFQSLARYDGISIPLLFYKWVFLAPNLPSLMCHVPKFWCHRPLHSSSPYLPLSTRLPPPPSLPPPSILLYRVSGAALRVFLKWAGIFGAWLASVLPSLFISNLARLFVSALLLIAQIAFWWRFIFGAVWFRCDFYFSLAQFVFGRVFIHDLARYTA